LSSESSGLLADLYELTMAAAYHRQGMLGPASFELFVRRLPEPRNFLVACGLEQALDHLEGWRFDASDIDYLRTLDLFDDGFLACLAELRFTGDVWAVPEGEVVFAEEPIVRVTAPMVEAQLVETFLLTTLTFQTMVASKAARVALACGNGRTFVDFSGRRDHGPLAAVLAARAAYVGGAAATSNVLAGRRFGLPLSGTMAHSYVMAFADELEAFRCYARQFPGQAVLLIDTYDTVRGAQRAAQVARELAPDGIRLRAVRLDSGDLADLAPRVRAVLDEAGLGDVRIIASGDLDEHRIAALVGAGVPIDAFGVGTMLGTSADAPYLGGVYKLVEDEHGPKVKLSAGKRSWPGRKQVFRGPDGDVVGLADEDGSALGRPLLQHVMGEGRRTDAPPSLAEIRDRRAAAVAALPADLHRLDGRAEYPVRRSDALEVLAAGMKEP
jgi:nicotinate phosphoribosyltransferase